MVERYFSFSRESESGTEEHAVSKGLLCHYLFTCCSDPGFMRIWGAFYFSFFSVQFFSGIRKLMCRSCNNFPSSPSTAEQSTVGERQLSSTQTLQLHTHRVVPLLHSRLTLSVSSLSTLLLLLLLLLCATPLLYLMSTSCLPAGRHPRAAGSVGEPKERHGRWADRFPGPAPPCQP